MQEFFSILWSSEPGEQAVCEIYQKSKCIQGTGLSEH